ncbi:MAG: DNA recombination protein RmuC [Rikenellaceae bacterium]
MTTTIAILLVAIALFAATAIALYLNLVRANNAAANLECDIAELNEELNRANTIANNTTRELDLANAKIAAMVEQKQILKEEQERRDKTLADQFKGMAADILAEQTERMNQRSKESIDQLLKPFQENIKAFRERVESIHSTENTQRGALQNELKNLMDLNRKITAETNNLTSALRGNSKVQGDWGEMILERILESSNLIKGTHYTTQENLKGEDGNNLRPDVILKLPEGKSIVIDSKTSLTAFVDYNGAENEAQRKELMAAHILSVKLHIKELANKEYQRLLNSPDFVIMFIPSEPAFLAAMHAESGLWAEAYENKVIISSPTNLFAMLKMVNDIWRRDAQDKNTEKIVEQGSKLYDQLTLFVESMDDIGAALGKAQTSYDKAYKQLATGKGNALKQGQNLKELGIKNKRELSAKAATMTAIDLE